MKKYIIDTYSIYLELGENPAKNIISKKISTLYFENNIYLNWD